MKGKVLFTATVFFGLFTCLGPARAENLTVPEDHDSIQDAITAAQEGDTVTVSRGSYDEDFTLKEGVVVQGEEAAETILTGTVDGTGGTLQRFTIEGPELTFAGADDGLVIRNNIFVDSDATALRIEGSTGVEVSNNTFYRNDVGLEVANSTGTVRANLFADNQTALPTSGDDEPTVEYNLFHGNTSIGTEGDFEQTGEDPLLVDPDAADSETRDFHLRTDSPCIDVVPAAELADLDGTDADCGAYGGPDSDPIPFRVSGLNVTTNVDEENAATLEWDENLAYNVSGYQVHYGLESGNLDNTEDVGDVTSFVVTGLSESADPPPAPGDVELFPGDRSLTVTWDEVQAADGYLVFWDTSSRENPEDYANSEDVGDVTRHTIGGLKNGVTYFVAVQSYAATTYFFAVTAFTDVGERTPLSEEEEDLTVEKTAGAMSEEASEEPEEVSGFPDLPDRGFCFIDSLGTTHAEGRLTPLVRLALVLGVALSCLALVRRPLRVLVPVALLLLTPLAAPAQEPRWALDAKAGVWLPAEDDWDDHFDSEVTADFKVGLGFKVVPWLEIGLEVGYREADGDVDTTVSGRTLGDKLDQTLRVVPVQPYVLFALDLVPDQLLVPYVAGGVNRYYYHQEIDGADDTDGYMHGYHVRGGLKLLLNRIEPDSAGRARRSFGLKRTYFVVEAQYAKVDDFGDESTDLGGWSFLGGASLEF